MSEAVEVVKGMGERFRARAGELLAQGELEKSQSHQLFADSVDVLLDRLRDCRKFELNTSELGDLSDLPDALRAELSVGRVDEMERRICEVIGAAGGEANLDQILIGLYRAFGEASTRASVKNKLWRMRRKGLIEPCQGRAGVYALRA